MVTNGHTAGSNHSPHHILPNAINTTTTSTPTTPVRTPPGGADSPPEGDGSRRRPGAGVANTTTGSGGHSGGAMEDLEEDAVVEARPWSEAWYDFCLTSPVRGLRQVTESTPFTVRR